MNFGAVLAGVAVGGGKADAQNVVDDLSVAAEQLAVHHFAGLDATLGTEHPVQNGKGIASAEAQNADGAGDLRRCDGGDGIHRRAPFGGLGILYHDGVKKSTPGRGGFFRDGLRLALSHP